MALKYWFEFTDIKEIVHRVEISNTAFTGTSTQIYGSCSLEVSETKDTLEPFRGSGLQIEIEANSNLTFYDLYSEEERTFSVVYKRNNQILFNGWLSPEGLYEDFVADHWIISLDCTDGLGFLNNLSYVEDATGLTFSGKQTLLEIVVNCLKRTKTPQNILTAIKIYYVGLSQSVDPFANVSYNADRFVKGDDNTIMNCEEVLKSVLEPFGAVLTSYNGEWLLYKPNSLVDASSQTFFSYTHLGVALSPTTKTIDFLLDLGSQIDNFYPHHVNANQQKSIKSSIGAFRINYKYGLVKGFINNIYLNSISDTNIPDYTILNSTYLSFPSDRSGLIIESISSIYSVVELSNSISLGANSLLIFYVKYFSQTWRNRCQLEVKLTTSSNTYYLKTLQLLNSDELNKEYSGEWVTTQNYLTFGAATTYLLPYDNSALIKAPALPDAGIITMKIFTSTRAHFSPTGNMIIKEINITPVAVDDNLKGENHTFQRKLKPSSKIKDIKKVFNGDNPSDIYFGTIYKADQTTPTENWTRYGASQTKPILQIMGEERMKMYAKPLQVFSGDVYGYFNYVSLISINGLTGKFMPTRYQYNAIDNTTSLILTEVLNTDVISDVDYIKTFDYGNVVEPTIKG